MESILARALEYTLKYWLKSFTRDQFKLQGRTAQLSNLDINGDALHASLGLPPALHVTTAKVGKLEILLPSVSNVQVEPIVVQIDRLDLVLEENDDLNASSTANSSQSSASSAKGSGYGFADKIADGMTIEVRTVNLLLETRSARSEGGGAWASPIASITMRNLSLYTTNENWQVVNLKEVRDFFTNKKFIYVFKKLEWEYLSIDLLPHPDMFAAFASSQDGSQKKDNDGAKRVFFGGERFIEGIAGEAYITIQRTDLNTALGLEVQLHITEVVCPALSEPGLRALLRFFTGLYVCLNRGDVNPNAQQLSTEAAGRSLVSIIVDHIFLCVKDAEFQLELLMQSLFFSRASDSDGENAKYLTRVMLGGLFLRDTFSRPPCTLVQPSMQTAADNVIQVPDFAKDFLPPIYPLGDERWRLHDNVPLISLHSLQLKPSPSPPHFASQTVICCLPLMIHLQQESCLRISSFIADGVVVNPADLSPDFSVNSLEFRASGFDVTVPMETGNFTSKSPFAGARLHIEKLFFTESPSLKLKLLNLEKDPACYSLWEDQPIDASQKKWTAGSSLISLSLETGVGNINKPSSELWRCVEFKGTSIEVAMATADGSPLINVPPPGGIVRVGVSWQQYLSNTSVEQFFFVLDLYEYFCRVSEKIVGSGKENDTNENNNQFLGNGNLIEKVPGDTAVTVAVNDIQLSFLEASSIDNDIQGMPLVKFGGENLFVKVSHRTLGGALAISSSLRWHKVQVDCADTESPRVQLRPVFWVQEQRNRPLLDINMVSVIPYSERDMECHSVSLSACIAGVRLGGGMNYTEALLHRFGILGPDGGPARELSKGLQRLYKGPLSTLFNPQPPPLVVNQRQERNGSCVDEEESSGFMQLGTPDDMDVSVELKDWLFALEGADNTSSGRWLSDSDDTGREVRCWHTTFRSLKVKAKASPSYTANGTEASHNRQRFPIELVTVGVDGLKTLKPNSGKGKDDIDTIGGVNVEADILVSEEDAEDRTLQCVVENFKFSVKQPIEAVVTKDELQHLAVLCKSEVESMSRIALGALKVLKLEGSIGQSTIDQLSNLGNGGYERLFTPEKLSREGSESSTVPSPSTTESPHPFVESTFASLEEALLDSQAKCSTLIHELSDSQKHATNSITVQQLNQKLQSMQKLLKQLRTQI